MSSRGKCNIRNVLIFLQESNFEARRAETLGTELGVPKSRIHEAVANHGVHGSFELALIDIIQDWLNNDSEASWEALASALRLCPFVEVAERIRQCAGQTFILANILRALRSNGFPSDRAQRLGVMLEIPGARLQSILASRGVTNNVNMALADIIQAWFQNQRASWNELDRALRAIEAQDISAGDDNNQSSPPRDDTNIVSKPKEVTEDAKEGPPEAKKPRLMQGAITDPAVKIKGIDPNTESDCGSASSKSHSTVQAGLPMCSSDRHCPDSLTTLARDDPIYFTKFGPDLKVVHEKNIKGNGIKIAIIDSFDGHFSNDGIMKDHMALKNANLKIVNMTSKDSNCPDTDHALVCVAIAIGRPYKDGFHVKETGKEECLYYPGGIAPEANATLFLINHGDKHQESLLKALDQVAKEKFDVLSMSFGGRGKWMEESIKKIHSNGTIMVAAAGNGGGWEGTHQPALFEEVISVASLDTLCNPSKFAAKGEISFLGEVMVPVRDSTGRKLQFWKGTSMATPGIAGLICLLLQCAKKYGYSLTKKKILNYLNRMIIIDKHTKFDELIEEFLVDAFDEKNFFKTIDRWQ